MLWWAKEVYQPFRLDFPSTPSDNHAVITCQVDEATATSDVDIAMCNDKKETSCFIQCRGGKQVHQCYDNTKFVCCFYQSCTVIACQQTQMLKLHNWYLDSCQ